MIGSNIKKVLAVAALGAGMVIQSGAYAAFITYTDRSAFEAAAAGVSLTLTNEDFAVDPGDPFTITDGTNSVTLDHDGSYGAAVIQSSGFDAPVSAFSTAVTGVVAGIGFDYALLSPAGAITGGTIEINGSSVTANNTSFTGFIGLLSTDGMTISSVDLLEANPGSGAFSTAEMDNIVIATGTPSSGGGGSVPVPGTLLLLGGALGLLGGGRRRLLGRR